MGNAGEVDVFMPRVPTNSREQKKKKLLERVRKTGRDRSRTHREVSVQGMILHRYSRKHRNSSENNHLMSF